jgi:drug/metabolite transporter (DMT)-like permease
MALPPPSPRGRHGPFGEKAFKAALVGCVILIVAGFAMLGGGDAVASVGTAFLVLGTLGLATSGLGLLAERRIERRDSEPPDPPQTD